MQAQKEAPADMQCKDKFLLQSVKVNDGATAKEINAEMVITYRNVMNCACEIFDNVIDTRIGIV